MPKRSRILRLTPQNDIVWEVKGKDMPLETILRTDGVALTDAETERVRHQLRTLERRLVHRPGPTATLVLKRLPGARLVEVDLRVQVGPLGLHLISHQSAETADRAVKLAVEDVERQLERQDARQRGEPSFGVPSRRLPAQERPSSRVSQPQESPEAEDDEAG